MMNTVTKIKDHGLLIAILTLAFILRYYKLDFQSIWLDEIFTMKETNPDMPFKEFVSTIHMREGMGHFYFVIVRTLNDIFGYSTFTARMFSVVIGVLSVYALYDLGKTIYSKNAGLIAALLLTVNFFGISYSQEARPYMLLMLFIILTFTRLVLFIRNPNTKTALLLGLMIGLIINAHMVGLITILSQAVLLLFVFCVAKKEDRFTVFKLGIIVFVTALLVASPTYHMFLKMMQYKSGWLTLPGPDGFSEIFRLLLGYTELLYFIFSALIIYFLVKLFGEEQKSFALASLTENKLIFSAIILFTWFFLPVLIPVIKSYTSEPMILHRYFIGLLPALVLTIAISLDMIKSQLVKVCLVITIVSFSLADLMLVKDYYNKISKAQFREVTDNLNKRNVNKDKVVSTYGWLMGYFIDQGPDSAPTVESPFSLYISSMKNGSVPLESFWYIDGNSLPYNLSAEEEAFLNENFKNDVSIERYDVWTRHYVSKTIKSGNAGSGSLNIKNFKPVNYDQFGNVMLFENSTITSPALYLEQGSYNLIIEGTSLPQRPINGENAHLVIKIGNREVGSCYLSENPNQKQQIIPFENKYNQNCKISLMFDNDIAQGELDRNMVLFSIRLEKK